MKSHESFMIKIALADHARAVEWLTYRHWEDWRDDPNIETKKLALKAKCFGIVAFDRVIRRASKW